MPGSLGFLLTFCFVLVINLGVNGTNTTVKFRILDQQNGTSAQEIATTLLQKIKTEDVGYPVLSVNFLASPTASPTSSASNDSFSKTFLGGDYIVSWQRLSDEVLFFTLDVACTGWVGIGFPTTPAQMIYSDVIIGWVTSTGEVVVDDYYVESKQVGCPGVCQDTKQSGINDIFNVSGSEANGRTKISFSRKLVTGDVKDNPISSNGNTQVIYAFSSEDSLQIHDSRGYGQIDFFTGSGELTMSDDYTSMKKAHGALMFVAWMVLIPAAIFIAHFLRSALGVWWFRAHVTLASFGIAMAIASFGVIIAMVDKSGVDHFSITHHNLGLATMVMMFATFPFGMLADWMYKPNRTSTPFFPDYVHWIFGFSTLIVSFVTIFYGLEAYRNLSSTYYILVGIWTGFLFFSFFILHVFTAFGTKSSTSPYNKKILSQEVELPINQSNSKA